MRLRHGTKGRLWNGIVTGFSQGVRVGSECDAYVADGSLFVKNSAIYNNATNYNNAGIIETDGSYGNTTSGPTLSGFIGVDPAGAIDPSSIDMWFSSANFRGAVEAGNDWTAGWTLSL